MRDDLIKALLPEHGEPIDPVAMARKDLARKLPAKFFKTASAGERDGGFALLLDGKGARTPGGHPLAVAHLRLAQALADEWNALTSVIDPGEMPLTRLVNSALDGVAANIDATRAEVVKYAGSDLLCYRAGEPASLVSAQAAAWDPVLDWARHELGARFILSQGVMFVDQPETAIAAIRAAVGAFVDPVGLAALASVTTLTGSVLLALALAHGRISPSDAWAAANVDEDFQMRAWGEDAEALARRARREREMQAAAIALSSIRA